MIFPQTTKLDYISINKGPFESIKHFVRLLDNEIYNEIDKDIIRAEFIHDLGKKVDLFNSNFTSFLVYFKTTGEEENDKKYKKFITKDAHAYMYCKNYGHDDIVKKSISNENTCLAYCYFIKDDPEVRYKIKTPCIAFYYRILINKKDKTMNFRSLPIPVQKILKPFIKIFRVKL